VVTRPMRKGFGTAILFEAAKHFSQNVEAEYAPEGLTYNLVVALHRVESSEGHLDVLHKAKTSHSHFFPFRFGP
jgi:hypothetical protein